MSHGEGSIEGTGRLASGCAQQRARMLSDNWTELLHEVRVCSGACLGVDGEVGVDELNNVALCAQAGEEAWSGKGLLRPSRIGAQSSEKSPEFGENWVCGRMGASLGGTEPRGM